MSSARKNHPVLTLVAGPNGSGKSTIVTGLAKISTLGVLVNADQIAETFARRKGDTLPSQETQWEAAHAAEDMRWALVSQRISFVAETVMSDRDRWVRFIKEAKEQGYRVVLYFVSTEDPLINIRRVAERVSAGGHTVDPEKIVSRYRKVMEEVLPDILQLVDEAILFDNSSPEEGATGVLRLKDWKPSFLVNLNVMPSWVSSLLDRL